MPISLYKEPEKKQITEKDVLENFEIYENTSHDCWSIKYKNQVIFKSTTKPTKEEVKTFLQKENPTYLKKFMEKLKETNRKRVDSIQERKERKLELKKKLEDDMMTDQLKKSMEKTKDRSRNSKKK